MSSASALSDDADALYARGRGQRAQRDDAGAEASYREALKLRPDFPDAWISLGILLKQNGRLAEAEAAHRAALECDSRNYVALLNLGNVLQAQGRSEHAMTAYRLALEVNPDCAEAHNNLARQLLENGARDEAIRHFAEALRSQPRYFEAAAGIGRALLDSDEYLAAIEPLSLAYELRPDDLDNLRRLARSHSGAGDYVRAANLFEALLAVRPRDRDARFDLALVQFYGGQYTRPRATLEALLAEHHDHYSAMAYASLLLRGGEYREGWTHYASRWVLGEPGLRQFPEPRWFGEPLTGRTLLIAREQGLGDEIMFASIIPEVLPLAEHCILECEDRLVDLYRRSFPSATVFGVGHRDPEWHTRLDAARSSLPRFDCWTPLGDLARLRRNAASDFPRHTGYLRADAARVDEFRARLASRAPGALNIGIGWRGGTARTRAAQRSLMLEELRPLFTVPGTRFVSLQYGSCREELDAFQREHGIDIDHWQEAIDDIDASAALIESLDLVISACSAVIHLTGALGRPAWVLAPLVPEWRYGHSGESMIWYPSVRMFRRDRSRDWSGVVGQVRRALVKLPRQAA